MNTTMKQSSLNGSQFREDVWTQVIADALDAGEVPPTVQDRLDRSYAALPRIPQEAPAICYRSFCCIESDFHEKRRRIVFFRGQEPSCV